MTKGRRGSMVTADDRAIAALLNGATMAQAAEAAGYSERTVRRHRDTDPEFRRRLEEGREETIARVVNSLASAATAAVRTLLLACTSDDVGWPTRVAAAGRILDLTVGARVQVTGADGGPVVIEAVSPQDELLARLERLAPRPVIEAAIAAESGNGDH